MIKQKIKKNQSELHKIGEFFVLIIRGAYQMMALIVWIIFIKVYNNSAKNCPGYPNIYITY